MNEHFIWAISCGLIFVGLLSIIIILSDSESW